MDSFADFSVGALFAGAGAFSAESVFLETGLAIGVFFGAESAFFLESGVLDCVMKQSAPFREWF